MNIMPTRFLNSLNTDEVVSAKMIEAYLGEPVRRLLIFTGVAIVTFESNGQLDGQEVVINLNARSNTRNPDFTATVGLASIYNEISDLVFATDDVTIVTDDNFQLFLKADIAAMGHRSVLNRFSYQAMVYLDAENGSISGSIRWNPHFMIFNAAMEQDLFQIEAYSLTLQPESAGGLGNYIKKIERIGHTLKQPFFHGSLMEILYEINDLPIQKGIFVTVEAKPGAFTILNTASNFTFAQVSGPPQPFKFSQSHFVEKPVDFQAREYDNQPR